MSYYNNEEDDEDKKIEFQELVNQINGSSNNEEAKQQEFKNLVESINPSKKEETVEYKGTTNTTASSSSSKEAKTTVENPYEYLNNDLTEIETIASTSKDSKEENKTNSNTSAKTSTGKLEQTTDTNSSQEKLNSLNDTNNVIKSIGTQDSGLTSVDTGTLESQGWYNFKQGAIATCATISDVLGDITDGFVGVFENAVDLGANIVATIQDVLGFDEAAKNTRDWASIDYSKKAGNFVANNNLAGGLYHILSNDATLYEMVTATSDIDLFEDTSFEEESIVTGVGDDVFQAVGYTLGIMAGDWALGAAGMSADISVNIGSHVLSLPTLSIISGMASGLEEVNAKGEDVTELERWSKAISGGLIEGFTEGMFGTFGIGGNDITDALAQKITSKIGTSVGKIFVQLGISATGEAIEEFVSYGLNYLVDNGIINRLGSTDFSSEWSWSDVGTEMGVAFASTLILQSGTSSFQNNAAVKSAEKQLGRELTQEEKAEVIQTVINQAKGELEDQKEMESFYEEANSQNIGLFYVTQFNNNGEITSVTTAIGEAIDSTNNKVNVSPVIVKDKSTNSYNVIDGETGVLLDTTSYPSIISAKSEFSSKLINLSDTSINEINKKIANSTYSINETIGEIVNKTRTKKAVLNSQETNSDNLSGETANLLSENGKSATGQNKANINISNSNSNNIGESTFNNSNQYNYAVNDIDAIISSYSEKETYTANEVMNIWNNIIDNEESSPVTYITDSEGNIQSYIDLSYDKDNNIITITQYDNDDNVVKSVNLMPNENGTYNKADVISAITEIATNYNENAPINGQIDIEGNQVQNNNNTNITNTEKAKNSIQNVSSEDIQKSIDNFKNAKGTVSRQDIINIVNELDIPIKEGATKVFDTEMSKKVGQNTNPQIVNITKLFKGVTDKNAKEFRNKAIQEALEKFRDTEVTIIDTNSIAEINKSGIDKTFSGKVTEEKIQTADNIKEIVEESIYGYTTQYNNDPNNILYHHFFTPIKYNDNGLIRVVIKEFTNDVNQKDKYYYHQLEYISNKKIEGFDALSQTNGNKEIKSSSSINSSIAQKNNSVKQNTKVNNKSMQKSENNTSKSMQKRDRVSTKNTSSNTSDNSIRSMKKKTTTKQNGGLTKTQYDSNGNALSYQQAQYFKDSKVRDSQGNLLVVYHGSNKEFTVFDTNAKNKNGRMFGDGVYLTKDLEQAKKYTKNGNIIQGYVNITNPFYIKNQETIEYAIRQENPTVVADIYNKDNSLSSSKIKNYLLNRGYDGINIANTMFVAYSSNQIKNIDNTSPTSNDDIRYLKKSSSKNNSTKTIQTTENNISNNTNQAINNNIYNNYTQKEIDNFKNSKTIRIANSENDVLEFVENAKNMPSNLKLYFGKVNVDTAQNIENTLGLNVDNYNISLKSDAIRHILINNHGDANTELLRGQVAITEQDILNIPDIINNYDAIRYSGLTEQGKPSITFEKNINGNNVAVTYISDKHNNLEMQTMYKFKNNRRNVSPASNTTNVLNRTPKANSSIVSSNNSIAQNSESVKNNAENTNTSKKNTTAEEGQRNAERDTAYIEQEIQKIEKTGNWDNSIPVTKMTDIKNTIEDYLGIGIQKGHFREHAYAIYKGNRDVIRTREIKDMDSILHEVGHALDIGNRIEINKEAISEELLKAVDNYGGYETENRSVRLEEGFAEVIREYTIVPEQAKIDYPQTVSVIENIKATNKDFNTFISKIQEQTYNYIHQNPRNRVLSNQSIGKQANKSVLNFETIKREVMRNVYDRDYAVKDTVNSLAKSQGKNINDVKASENAYYLARLSNGIGDKVTSILANGYIDEDGNKLMPGLNKLGDILEQNPERYNDLRTYLVAQRDLEYKAKKLKTGIRTTDSKAVIEQFKNDAQIQEAAKLVYDTVDGVLQYTVNNGLITQEVADILRDSNTFYVPMQRALENGNNQIGRRGAVTDVIKRRTGSELDIKDVLENVVANSTNMIQQVENNNVLKAIYKQGEASGLKGYVYDVIPTPVQKVGTAQLSMWEAELQKQGVNTFDLDLEKTTDLFAPNNKIDAKNLTTSFINDDGKRVYLQFKDELLFNSLMNIDKKFASQVLNISSKLNMPLRYGATMANIGFAIPNMISDTAQATIFSTAGFIPVVDNAIGVLDILAATNKSVAKFVEKVAPEYAEHINRMYMLYEQSGATNSTRLSQYKRQTTQGIMKDIYGTKNSEVLGIDERFKPLKGLLDIMTYLPEISEQSTRFRVFERNYNYYLNKGNSETDARIMAALEARDATQDFSRTGNITREINQLIPFSAARVGSIYTFSEKVKANPKQVGIRIAILTALAMGIKAIGYDDKEIEELNQRKKDDNFVLKVGDTVVTIKKPQGILRSIINLAEYIQDLATGHIEEGKEAERLGEWLNNAIMDNMPADEITGLVPNAIAPLIENAINKDFYYNTDIVQSYDLDLPEADQYYDYNSQLAIWLGSIFNYSPAKIDNLISGYFGGLGTSVTNVIDWVSGKVGLSAEEANMGAEDNAVGKRFIVNVNTNSQSIDDIYDRKDELTKKKNGETITEEEIAELETLTTAISSISKVNKQMRSIKQDLTLSANEKAEQIRVLQSLRTDIARQALGKELIDESNASQIEIMTFYPTSDTLSLNGVKLTLTDSMKQEYAEIANEIYNEYLATGLYSKDYYDTLKSKCKEYAKKSLMQKYQSLLVAS